MPLEPTCANIESELFEGLDVSVPLNIVKWEAPVNAQLAGQVKGNFPSSIPKTDQERVQNLTKEIKAAFDNNLLFELTEKLEGSSMTCYLIEQEFGVCSRNLDLKRTDDNTLWKVAIEDKIELKMRIAGLDNHAIQGELVGPGIQGNIYKLSKPMFFVFDIYDIKKGAYMNPVERQAMIKVLQLNHVPVLTNDKDLGIGTVDELLLWAEGKSVLNEKQEREGIVFKQIDGGMTFKAISNKYLLG